ncbi:hypothetical protein SAMN05444410_11542 [Hydrobacter penzbergensis]|uniref:Uncharacterized protein n=1 Tax=Hydrobacter penzbergensis TaxID=1235997 RepID=A0A8X8LEV6_9BACT|nr:hypothetical protein SAMN05444410_11542 [Hydrobacter penzbergensis]
MPTVTFTVTINSGVGDTSINIFNHRVTLEHFFDRSDSWDQILAQESYNIGIAGHCPPGGNISIDIKGITSSSKTLPLTVNSAGPFLKSLTISV